MLLFHRVAFVLFVGLLFLDPYIHAQPIDSTLKDLVYVSEIVIKSEDFLETYSETGRPIRAMRRAQSIMDSLENIGYATLSLEKMTRSENDTIFSTLIVDPQFQIRISNVSFKGAKVVKESFYEQLLEHAQPDRPYLTSQLLDSWQAKLNELDFVNFPEEPKIVIIDSAAFITYYPRKKNVNEFDVNLGLQRNGQSTELTGVVDLALHSIMKRGEKFTLDFQRLQTDNRQMGLQFSYPYLFNLPVTTHAEFTLFANDSSYLDVHYGFGVTWKTSGGHELGISTRPQRSRVLNYPSNVKILDNGLPEYLPFNSTNASLSYAYKSARSNDPRRYNNIMLGINLNRRVLQSSAAIDQLPNEISQLYAMEERVSGTYGMKLLADAQFYLKKWFYVQPQLNIGLLENSKDNILLNEMFQVGGVNSFRGFNERQIFTESYGSISTSWHYFIDDFSSLFVLNEYGGFQQDEDFAHFFTNGFGLSLQTELGKLDFLLANAIQQGQAFDFFDTRIHLRYVNVF